MKEHPWKLVGPWYRWHDPDQVPLPDPLPDDSAAGDPALGRDSRPILQKYASPRFVEQFLKNPPCSLRFDQKDFVHEVVTLDPADVPATRLSNKVYRKSSANRRKIFLTTHSRFYLVVCELHCDTAGFPSVRREQVCEAGFVVRRRKAPVPAEAAARFEEVLGRISRARHRATRARRKIRTQRARFQSEPAEHAAGAVRTLLHRQATRQDERLRQARAELRELTRQHDVLLQAEAWVESAEPGIGAWQTLEDELPHEIREDIFPLYPLVPDPSTCGHAAAGKSLWFGVLPTGGTDADERGNPRFDDRQTYEIRCFVRRHDPKCPRTTGRNDCRGEIVWSRPTESYQLASQFDLAGTSNRVVTIQLPDLQALEAQTSGPDFSLGQGVGVAMVTPPGSELPFTVNADQQAEPTAPGELPSICFFSIPLITIVATFLLRLFLPIVVFLFGLWYLLRLKFCILPSFSLDAGLSAELEAALEGGAELSAELELKVKTALAENLPAPMADGLKALDPRAQGQLVLDLATDFRQSAPEDISFEGAPPPVRPAPLPSATEDLQSYCEKEPA